MIKEAIGTADTLEEAKEIACRELGDAQGCEIEFEVLQMPEKKKLGLFGGCPAKVRAYFEVTPLMAAQEYLESVIKCMGSEGIEIQAEKTEDGASFTILGDDVGHIIGRRGDTLDALQYLCGLVANHVDGSYFRVSIDAGSYREKRVKTLEGLGRKHGILAARKGIKHSFEPMNPYERRIIHTAVQEIDGAISWSEGQGYDRHVVIGPDPAKKNMRKGGNRQGKFRNSRPRNDFSEARVPTEPKAVDSFGDMNVSLYQKIEYKPADESAE